MNISIINILLLLLLVIRNPGMVMVEANLNTDIVVILFLVTVSFRNGARAVSLLIWGHFRIRVSF